MERARPKPSLSLWLFEGTTSPSTLQLSLASSEKTKSKGRDGRLVASGGCVLAHQPNLGLEERGGEGCGRRLSPGEGG